MESAWTDLPSGSYHDGAQKARLTAVSASKDTQLVYTLDGSEPTPQSAKAQSGTSLTIPTGKTTLKVGLLVDGKVRGVITRQYEIGEFQPYDITVYVNGDAVAWTSYINFHSWGGSHTATDWPGDHVTTTQTVGGKKWFCKSYTMTTPDDNINFVFSIGTADNAGQQQTVDINNIRHDAFFEVTGEKSGGKYLVKDVTTTMGVEDVATDRPTLSDDHYYTLSGQRVTPPLRRGIYLHKGKKIMVK